MSGLTIQQMMTKVGLRIGLRITQAPVGSTDFQIQQLLELFNEEVYETGTRYRWQRLTEETSFTTAAQEDQGVFVGAGGILTDSDHYSYIISDTMWDRTARQPVIGPESTTDWQTRLALAYTSGPFPRFRIRANRLLMSPTPSADNDVYFEFATKKFVYDPNADTYGATFEDNEAVPVLDSDLIMQGVRWRWKMVKGFPYAEEQRTHQLDVLNASSRETGNKTLNLGGGNGLQQGQRSGDLTVTEL